jgi:hypothetical protein
MVTAATTAEFVPGVGVVMAGAGGAARVAAGVFVEGEAEELESRK